MLTVLIVFRDLYNWEAKRQVALDTFEKNKVNMTWIETYSMQGEEAGCLFFLEFEGHAKEAKALTKASGAKVQIAEASFADYAAKGGAAFFVLPLAAEDPDLAHAQRVVRPLELHLDQRPVGLVQEAADPASKSALYVHGAHHGQVVGALAGLEHDAQHLVAQIAAVVNVHADALEHRGAIGRESDCQPLAFVTVVFA